MTGGTGKGRAGGALACSGMKEEAIIGVWIWDFWLWVLLLRGRREGKWVFDFERKREEGKRDKGEWFRWSFRLRFFELKSVVVDDIADFISLSPLLRLIDGYFHYFYLFFYPCWRICFSLLFYTQVTSRVTDQKFKMIFFILNNKKTIYLILKLVILEYNYYIINKFKDKFKIK